MICKHPNTNFYLSGEQGGWDAEGAVGDRKPEYCVIRVILFEGARKGRPRILRIYYAFLITSISPGLRRMGDWNRRRTAFPFEE